MQVKDLLKSKLSDYTFVLAASFDYAKNENNKIRISDFKVITKKDSIQSWTLSLYGPDNKPFDIKHPKLGFKSNTWYVSKNNNTAPWFLKELPNTLFLLMMKWWMKALGYKEWIFSPKYSPYYEDLFSLNVSA